jgi:hypothetical protein
MGVQYACFKLSAEFGGPADLVFIDMVSDDIDNRLDRRHPACHSVQSSDLCWSVTQAR